MLKKIHRLVLNRDFRWIFKNGRGFEGDIIKVKIAKNQKDFSRFGFVVSTKISTKAHDRNLVKRRLRAAVRFLLPWLTAGYDIVIWPKKQIIGASYRDITMALENLFKKSSIWGKK